MDFIRISDVKIKVTLSQEDLDRCVTEGEREAPTAPAAPTARSARSFGRSGKRPASTRRASAF